MKIDTNGNTFRHQNLIFYETLNHRYIKCVWVHCTKDARTVPWIPS